jgi:hypothetical protein
MKSFTTAIISDLVELELFMAINEIDPKPYKDSIETIQFIIDSMKEDATCDALKIVEIKKEGD